MLSEVKHLALGQDLCQVVGVRFFAEFILERSEGLRMTSYMCYYRNHTCVKVSQFYLYTKLRGHEKNWKNFIFLLKSAAMGATEKICLGDCG